MTKKNSYQKLQSAKKSLCKTGNTAAFTAAKESYRASATKAGKLASDISATISRVAKSSCSVGIAGVKHKKRK
jgi:hypothetical protein